MAEVTVGLPVFNGERAIGRSIQSILDQTFGDYKLIISDNASTDKTREICLSYSSRDERIEYIRQEANIGAAANFMFVLERADTPYFMWAAADDYWLPDFIVANIQILKEKDDVVCSVSKVKLAFDDGSYRISKSTKALLSDMNSNVFKFLLNPSDNSRFYGVFRTDCLRSIYPESEFPALDWAVSAGTLLFGKHYEVDNILMIRNKTPTREYFVSASTERIPNNVGLFPLWPFTRHLIFHLYLPVTARLITALFLLNAVKTMEGVYYKLSTRIKVSGNK